MASGLLMLQGDSNQILRLPFLTRTSTGQHRQQQA
jgi:hypothetical protein